MRNNLSFLALLGVLLFLFNLVIGALLVASVDRSIAAYSPNNDARHPSITARDGPLGTCLNVWESGRMNRFTPGNPSRSMLNVCTPANTCIQSDESKGWKYFRSLGLAGKSKGCLIFTKDNCGEGQTFNPATNEMEVIDEWTGGGGQGDVIAGEFGSSRWPSLKCWRVETTKRDVVIRGALDDAVAATIVARNVEILPVKSSPV